MMYLIGKRIKKLRLQKNLTQEQLAKELNLSKSSISYYERGDRNIPIDILIKLSDFFRVDIDYILGISNRVRSRKRELQLSDDEIKFILELRRQPSYKYMISNPKNYARLIEMKTSDYVVKT